jgi:hypothetical protein
MIGHLSTCCHELQQQISSVFSPVPDGAAGVALAHKLEGFVRLCLSPNVSSVGSVSKGAV